MRKIIVAGNWKMNLSIKEAKTLMLKLDSEIHSSTGLKKVLVFPPFPYLMSLSQMINRNDLFIGSQNIAAENNGAFTGEVSANMIKELGLKYTLVGHSERRSLYGESNEIVKRKIDQAIANGLVPIFCCGENLDERENGIHMDVIKNQLFDSLFHLNESEIQNIIIAYEPVWAIGTGKTASVEQAEDMHAHIRSLFASVYGEDRSNDLYILYGGSCNSSNSAELFASKNVDGGLIGGASLKADEFLSMIAGIDE